MWLNSIQIFLHTHTHTHKWPNTFVKEDDDDKEWETPKVLKNYRYMQKVKVGQCKYKKKRCCSFGKKTIWSKLIGS
jgi:hypothetical protein